MCDQDHFEEDQKEFEALGLVTRKQFGMMLGAGMAMLLPQVANAVTVVESDVSVTTTDGTADCYFVHPATGTAPGVLVWPDIFGLRPAFRQMGKRLAESGYSVLVVNPFYRGAARKAGARRNDLIVEVDGKSTEGADLTKVVEWLRGAEGAPVTP